MALGGMLNMQNMPANNYKDQTALFHPNQAPQNTRRQSMSTSDQVAQIVKVSPVKNSNQQIKLANTLSQMQNQYHGATIEKPLMREVGNLGLSPSKI